MLTYSVLYDQMNIHRKTRLMIASYFRMLLLTRTSQYKKFLLNSDQSRWPFTSTNMLEIQHVDLSAQHCHKQCTDTIINIKLHYYTTIENMLKCEEAFINFKRSDDRYPFPKQQKIVT